MHSLYIKLHYHKDHFGYGNLIRDTQIWHITMWLQRFCRHKGDFREAFHQYYPGTGNDLLGWSSIWETGNLYLSTITWSSKDVVNLWTAALQPLKRCNGSFFAHGFDLIFPTWMKYDSKTHLKTFTRLACASTGIGTRILHHTV